MGSRLDRNDGLYAVVSRIPPVWLGWGLGKLLVWPSFSLGSHLSLPCWRISGSHYLAETWDPRKLPRVARHKDRVSRVESVFGLAFSILFIAWWLSLSR